MASNLIARRRSAYMQVKRAGIHIGLFPVSVDAGCEARKLPAGWENNLRQQLPVFDNVQYVPSGCADSTIAVPEATKLTALGLVRVSNGANNYLSLLASGSGALSYELEGLGGTVSPNPSKKLFDTVNGPYDVPTSIGSGRAAYGGFYGSLANGDYRLKIGDDTGGVSVFTISVTPNSPVALLKGALGIPGSGSGGGGGTDPLPGDGSQPTIVFQGNVRIDESQRPDLMKLVATPFKKSDGTWWFKLKDTATGNFQKSYRNMGRHYINQAQLEAGEWPFGYPFAVTCTEMSAPFTDDKLPGMDSKAHCVQKIFTS